MDPAARWQRVQQLCEELEALSPEGRAAHLAAREPDPAVREEALALFQALIEEQQRRAALQHALPAATPEMPPAIGEYAITGQLGRGGTSTVYAAEKSVGGVTQKVALKILHGYLRDPEALARFRREQEILARLDHPALSRVLDAGATEAGQPYLVLERVDGQPIDQFANQRRLSIAERIELILTVCDAIAGAHRSLVVHLDLKPGNLLVTAEGRVRVLDFGTAKLLDPAGALTTTRHLTPLYASPEQLRGEPVTTSCDIYSLGLVLYELLAGASPFDGAGILSVAERASGSRTTVRMAKRVTDQAARQRGTTTDRLRSALAGDLELVVAKALAPEPGRRYAAIGEFAGDLRRFLENRPVKAHPPTASYRLKKYASRNRGALAVTVMLLVALAGAAGYAWRAQRKAIEQGRRAEVTANFLLWLIQSSNPVNGGRRDMTVLELVGRASQRLERGDLADPVVTAALENSTGAYLFQSGQESQGIAAVERAAARARQAGAAAAELNAVSTLGTVLLSRGDCAAAILAGERGDALLAAHASSLPPVSQVSFLVNRDQLRAACENDPGGALTTRAVALLPRIPDQSLEAGMPARLLKALVLNAYVRLLVRQGKAKEAREAAGQGLQLAAQEPDGRNVRVALLQSRAAAEYAARDVAAAARSLDEAATLAESTAAPFEAIRLKVMAGQRLAEAGQKERAVALADQALRLAEERKADLTQTRWMILIDAAITYFRADQCVKTAPLLAEADQLTQGKMPPQWKGNRLGVEAFCLARSGRAEDAKRVAAQAIAAAGTTWSASSTFRKNLELLLQNGQ